MVGVGPGVNQVRTTSAWDSPLNNDSDGVLATASLEVGHEAGPVRCASRFVSPWRVPACNEDHPAMVPARAGVELDLQSRSLVRRGAGLEATRMTAASARRKRASATWAGALVRGGSRMSLAMGVLALAACQSHAVGAAGDADLEADAARADASVPPPDGAVPDALVPWPCQAPALAMGFVWGTPIHPDHPDPGTEELELMGVARYHGPITVPLAQSPAFNQEVQLEHDDGQVSVLQYFLPEGLRLPIDVGTDYVLFLRRVDVADRVGVGLVVSRPTSGLPPLLFVGDAGPSRVFAPEDLRLTPFKIYVEPRSDCGPVSDPACGGQIWPDRLRFDSSTGGAVTDVVVSQSESASLLVFGEPFLVLNLASNHRDPPCPDSPAQQAIYLAAAESMVHRTCAPERFRFWDDPAPDLGVGDLCDELLFCASPDQAAAAQAVAPDVACEASTGSMCDSGALLCRFPSDDPITETIYDEMCAVTVLESPPDFIQCQVYFY